MGPELDTRLQARGLEKKMYVYGFDEMQASRRELAVCVVYRVVRGLSGACRVVHALQGTRRKVREAQWSVGGLGTRLNGVVQAWHIQSARGEHRIMRRAAE